VIPPESRRGGSSAGCLQGGRGPHRVEDCRNRAINCFTRACIATAAVGQLRAQLEDVKGAENAICVQVLDMTGDGSVVKRRIRDGHGEFPVDCPIEDSSVRVHYR
jgi:hypothetical protein